MQHGSDDLINTALPSFLDLFCFYIKLPVPVLETPAALQSVVFNIIFTQITYCNMYFLRCNMVGLFWIGGVWHLTFDSRLISFLHLNK